MRRLFPIALLLVFATPPAAIAGTVSLDRFVTDPKYHYEQTVVSFRAAPGEQNRIVVSRTGTSGTWTFVLRDAGAPVRPGTGCTAIDERTVSCIARAVFVDAADGDDTVTLRHDGLGDDGFGFGYVRGGDGADVLTARGFLAGGPGDDVLTCPEPCGASVLAGGAGADLLRGGSGNDVLSGDGDGPPQPNYIETVLTESGAAGNDRIDGGAGLDQLSFEGRRTDATVDLAAGSSTGAAGERDTLAAIENAAGGDGDDHLLGDGADNTLEGDAGDDRIGGRGGADYLLGDLVPDTNEYSVTYTRGNDGIDTLRGGEGEDRLDAGSERGDVLSGGPGDDRLEDGVNGASRARNVRCGSGRDTIAFAPRGQRLAACEQLAPGSAGAARVSLRPQPRSRGRLRFDWTCSHGAQCVMGIGVRVGASKTARRRVSLSSGNRSAFLVRPVRHARRGDVIDVRIIVADRYQPYAAHWRVPL